MIPANWFKSTLATLVLILITSLVCFLNFSPGTYLIGWDNLLPEMNIWMNIKRSLFAVWQEYQGLGLVGGMGHATDLIRQLILLPFTFILPANLIRYLWHFAMLFLGTFGIYLGLSRHKFTRFTALAAALFYLLNFGSVQYFWAPLETFSAFWGFFPWLIFSLWEHLEKPTRRSLINLAVVNFLAIPAFYVQTLFVVYVVCIFLILLSRFLCSLSNLKTEIPNFLKTLLVILVLNSFWILPFTYYLKYNLYNSTEVISNYMANEDTFDRNTLRGYPSDFLLLRGYYYDFPNNDGMLMAPWISHFSNPLALACGYSLSFFVLIGLIGLIIIRHHHPFIRLSVLLLFLLSAVALLSSTPPFDALNGLIRSVSLIDQVFRSPFTKFLVPAVFSFSLLAAYGLTLLSKLLYIPQLIFITGLIIFSLPVFQGNYISPQFRRRVPDSYFKMFDYFKTLPATARIANLPQGTFWGWTNYNWGVTGSGFIWYGLEQPILDRAFDTWNLKDEQYYWELTTALQSEDPAMLDNVLTKYSVEYVLFDKSVIYPEDKIYAKQALLTRQRLDATPYLTLDKNFDLLSVYRHTAKNAPYLATNLPIANKFTNANLDTIYNTIGDYIASDKPEINFPFAGLFTNRLQSELNFTVDIGTDFITLNTPTDSQAFPFDNQSNTTVNHSLLPHPDQPDYYLKNTLGSDLLVFNFPDASQGQSYLAKVTYRHQSGMPLEVSAVSSNHQHKYFQTHLDKKTDWTDAYFIIPAREGADYNFGLNFIFNNISVNKNPTINVIKDIKIYPLPLAELQSTHTSDNIPPITSRTYQTFQSSIFYYHVALANPLPNSHLVLPQTFDPGWVAFYFRGFRPVFLKDHVLINNWANGWAVPPNLSSANSDLYLFFWPQLLEFLGLIFIPATFIKILRSKENI